MPDYTSILRRSVAALPASSPDLREAVYQRARAALARQLTAVEPPLSTREIERQHQDLEDAIARLEADHAPELVFEIPPDRPDGSASVPVEAMTPERKMAARVAAPADPRVQPSRADNPDEDDYEDDEDDYEDDERGSRTPLLVGLALLALVLVGAAAYAYAERDAVLAFIGLSDESAPSPAAEPSDSETVAAISAGEDAEPPSEAPSKQADRLTNGSDAPAPETPLPRAMETEDPAADPDAAPIEETPAEAPSADGPPVDPPPVEPGLAEALPAETDPAEATPAESDSAAPEEQTAALDPDEGVSIVAQRAIYYFQGAEGQPGRASEGSVAWAEITRENAPAVQATLRMADQDVTTTVTIYKNNDGTLPASHLVEVQFSGSIGPTPVQRVPALVMKQTEQARGQPLTGAAVPVTGELFWIALSDDAEQVTRNLQLLREGSWFDLPILFNDGTRALLTFEKGIPGDRVFETVMSSWVPG